MPPKTSQKPAASTPKAAPAAPAIPAGRRVQTRRSGVHGKGVFAVQDIAAGEVIMEYVGEIVSWQEAQDRHPHDPNDPNHTFYSHIDEDRVIDAKFGGNSSRWINHSCDPNCEAVEDYDETGRMVLRFQTLVAVDAGEELFIDYSLTADEASSPADYLCYCGTESCRGTMLALGENDEVGR